MKKNWKVILILSLLLNLSSVYIAYKALEYRSHINDFLEKYTYVIDEFSGRDDYLKQNQPLLADRTVPGRVVFMGTQTTVNWKLHELFQTIDPINRGIIGQRYAGYLLRFRSDVIALAPQAVVIEFSSYNFRPESKIEEFIEYTQSLTELALTNNIIPVITTVLPVGDDFDVEMEMPYSVNDSVKVYNQWVRRYCSENQIQLLDMYKLLVDTSGYFDINSRANQIQPNDNGYARLSEALWSVLYKIGISDQTP